MKENKKNRKNKSGGVVPFGGLKSAKASLLRRGGMGHSVSQVKRFIAAVEAKEKRR